MAKTIYPPADIGEFCIVADPESHWCRFTCYPCVGMEEGSTRGVFDRPLYEKKAASFQDHTSDVADAQVYLSDTIKWDGCADLRFDEQDVCCLHFCGREHAASVGKLLDRLYDLAAELIPAWDGKLAE